MLLFVAGGVRYYDHCSRLYAHGRLWMRHQIKMSWIVKALRTMVDLRLAERTEQEDTYRIPIPTIVSNNRVEIEICQASTVANINVMVTSSFVLRLEALRNKPRSR